MQSLIRQRELPPEPVLTLNRAEYRSMQTLMERLQGHVRDIKNMEENQLPDLKEQLAAAAGIFKGKERKALAGAIKDTEQEISRRRELLSTLVRAEGYPSVQAFMTAYKLAAGEVERYNREMTAWQRKRQESQPPAEKERPSQPRSVRGRLRKAQAGIEKHQARTGKRDRVPSG